MIMRFPGGHAKTVTLSYDDGLPADYRLVSIMDRHGIKGTFNINSAFYSDISNANSGIWVRMTKEDTLRLFKGSHHEVATHGLTHQHMTRMDDAAICHQIITDRINHEQDFECIMRGHAYPFGEYDDKVVECLRHCGIAYARTIDSTGKFSLPADWLRWHPTVYHNSKRLDELCDAFLSAEPRGKEPMCFSLWGHSCEFDRDDNWYVIENFCEKMGGRNDIWYATNIEIHDYTEAYRSLITSVKGNRVYNPTATDVWFEQWSGRIVCVKAGEELSL